MMSYFRLLNNPNDDASLEYAITRPRRNFAAGRIRSLVAVSGWGVAGFCSFDKWVFAESEAFLMFLIRAFCCSPLFLLRCNVLKTARTRKTTLLHELKSLSTENEDVKKFIALIRQAERLLEANLPLHKIIIGILNATGQLWKSNLPLCYRFVEHSYYCVASGLSQPKPQSSLSFHM